VAASLTRAELAAQIDHALVQPAASRLDVTRLCAEARQHAFHGVCVHSSRVELAYSLLEDTDFKVTCFVGFPFGAVDSDVKRYETEVAVDQGATEIEMVLNIGRLKDGDRAYVLRELRDIAEAAEERPVKVVLETALLSKEEAALACELVLDSGAHFVCTGTGLGAPPTVAEVRILRTLVGEKFGVKASGGIQDTEAALALISAGANRLGAFNGVALLPEVQK
jgi:deoxyribose-phosphate aldolase